MQQNSKQKMLQSGSAFKESGLMNTWKEKLLIYDLIERILRFLDVKAQTQKQLNLTYYDMKDIKVHAGKWTIVFKLKHEYDLEPKVAKFGWQTKQEACQWFEYFSGTYLKSEIKKQELLRMEEWDQQQPTSERIVSEPMALVPSIYIKPSPNSRMRQIIPTLPRFLQNDMELLLENTLDNLQGFSDIDNFKLIVDLENAQVYQDPHDNLHMKLIFYSIMPPQRIFDEFAMPSAIHNWSTLVKQFQMFPTKKDCAIVMVELELKNSKCLNLEKQNSAGDLDEQSSKFEKQKSSTKSLDSAKKENVKIVYTQKHLALDGFFCIIRKYTGEEIHHDQIESNQELDQYKITRSAAIIQPTKKQGYVSQIIEDIYVECEDQLKGEQVMKLLLLNAENLDNFLTKSDQYIKSQTQDIIVKNSGDLENQQISFRMPDHILPGITSEQHQSQSKGELINIEKSIQNGDYINKVINTYQNQEITQGVNAQLKTTQEEGHFLYTKYYEVDQKKGGLIYLNKTLMSNQKKVIFDMIKRMGSNLLSGKSIMAVSMPIQIFESRSFLERMARAQGHAPIFLEQGAKTQDPIEQMKFTMAFHLSSFMMGIQQEKPFNPIIGETFQGRILGCPIYLEQTSHHPPISNYIMFGRGYKLWGCFSPIVNMSTNSLSGEQHGHSIIQYQNTKLKFYYISQPFTVYGVTIGQRSVNCHKRSFCFCPELQLVGQIQFNPKDENASLFSSSNQKIDYFKGKIHKTTPEFIQRCLQAHKTNSGLISKLKLKQQDILETHGNIQGRWTNYIEFDRKRYWDIDIHRPYVLELDSIPLPSDCIYRLDLLNMKMKDMRKGQLVKEEMEIDQRKDKQLRDQGKKIKKKH